MSLKSHNITITGEVEISVYDKDNNLIDKLYKKNTIKDAGLACFKEMLLQGLNNSIPGIYASDDEETSLLSNENMFSGLPGEIPFYTPVVINNKKYSDISSGGNYNSQVLNTNNMFVNNSYSSTIFNYYSSNSYEGDLFVPNNKSLSNYTDRKNQSGYIFDISIKKIEEEFILTNSIVNLSNNNLKYNNFNVINKEDNSDVTNLFSFDCGTRTENGKLTFLSNVSVNIDDYLNKTFVVTYYRYDFEDEYISGIRVDMRSDNGTIVDNEYINISLSFNQGKTRTNAIFPMNTGNPNQCMFAKNSGLKLNDKMTSYFFSISPWFMKIPNQICILSSNKNNGLGNVYIEKIQFFKLRIPKLGPLGIYLKDNDFLQKVKIYRRKNDLNNSSVLFYGKLNYNEGNGHTYNSIGLCNFINNVLFYEDESISSKFDDDLTKETKFYRINLENKDLYDNILTEADLTNSFIKTEDKRIDLAYKISVNWGT